MIKKVFGESLDEIEAMDLWEIRDKKDEKPQFMGELEIYFKNAVSPASAGELAARFLRGEVTAVREAEVMDISRLQHGKSRGYCFYRIYRNPTMR